MQVPEPVLARDRTPVTGELVEWFPLVIEPCSLFSAGGLQYAVLFPPLLPPAIADTPTVHFRRLSSSAVYHGVLVADSVFCF